MFKLYKEAVGGKAWKTVIQFKLRMTVKSQKSALRHVSVCASAFSLEKIVFFQTNELGGKT